MREKIGALAVCAFAALLFAAPLPAQAATRGEIEVNGIDIVKEAEDNYVQCGEGYAKYDPETGVLTLHDAELTETTGSSTRRNIWAAAETNLNIKLEGDCTANATINASGEGESFGNITISGPGSLTITTDNKSPAPIAAYHDVVICDGATVIIDAPNSWGIQSQKGSVTIQGGAKVDVTAGKSEAVKAQTDILVTGQGTVLGVETIGAKAADSFVMHSYGSTAIEGGARVVTTSGVVQSDGNFTVKGGSSLAVTSGSDLYGVYCRGDITISGSTVDSTCANGQAMRAAGVASIADDSVVLLEGGKWALYAGDDLDLGGSDWYQWGTSATQTTQSADEPYALDQNDTYLRIEPAGTAYDVTVDGETSSHVPGSEVAISAEPYNADGHFAGWAVEGGDADALLADPTSPETTFTAPAGGATVTATYESHVLTHRDAQAPTCTDAGWEAYDECACGYSTYREVPAEGHAWGEPEWGWSEDGTEFVATFTCATDPSHIEVLTAEPAESVEKEPTCTEPGTMLYAATVELDGKAYRAEATAEIPATGHDYVDGVCTACGAKDPDYVAPQEPSKPEKDAPSLPATGDASAFFSLVPALVGASALGLGAAARRRS